MIAVAVRVDDRFDAVEEVRVTVGLGEFKDARAGVNEQFCVDEEARESAVIPAFLG